MIRFILFLILSTTVWTNEEAVDGQVLYKQMKRSADLLDKKILALRLEFDRLDLTTERLIQSSVDLLKASKDSAETKRSVFKNKKNFIAGLNANTKSYLAIQEKVKKQLAKTGLVYGEEFLKIHKWLDTRITLRTGQVTAIVNSLDSYKDVSEFDGAVANARESDAARVEQVKAMKVEIQSLSKKLEETEAKLQSVESVEQVKALSVNIESYHNRIQLLEMSVQDVLTASSQAEGLSKNKEEKLDQKLRKQGRALQGNLRTLLSHIRSFYALAEQRALIRYKIMQLEKILKKDEVKN